MESNDISKVGFNPKKHYTSVRMQEGRVLTDEDWNENERIENEERRRSRTQIIGPVGSQDNGFAIQMPQLTNPDNNIDFNICSGTFHIGGIRLELEKSEWYREQKDWLQKPATDSMPITLPNEGDERFDLVYLEAWQQGVSAVEDEELLEVALGGPDTTTRIRTMRRVMVMNDIGTSDCECAFQRWKKRRNQKGKLSQEHELVPDTQLKVTCVNIPPNQLDLCAPSAVGGYLGAENQAIRVQLVGQNHLTWGFNNAAPLYRVKVVGAQLSVIKILTEPKDQFHWPLSGQIIEILPWAAILPNNEKVAEQQGFLSKVTKSYNPDTQEFTIKTAIPNDFWGTAWKTRKDAADLTEVYPKACAAGIQGVSEYYYMRIWNRGTDIVSNEKINFTSGNPVTLGNTGLAVTITGQNRNSGDSWVIAARPETPNIVNPWILSVNKHPDAVRRFFAPLAIIKWFNNGIEKKGKVVSDCRTYFPALSNITASDVKFDHTACRLIGAKNVQEAIDSLCKKRKCTLLVSPGKNWHKIFDYIEDDQDALVCFQIGEYSLENTVELKNKGHITFIGGGKGSNIYVRFSESAFEFIDCKDITIRDLFVESKATGYKNQKNNLNGVLSMYNCKNISVENISLKCADTKNSKREASCITIRKNIHSKKKTTANIRHSHFDVGNNQVGILAVNTERTFIEGNNITGIVYKRTTISSLGNKGIVVAGNDISNIYIKDNCVDGFNEGIRIGASHRENQKGEPDMIGTASIIGNNIKCAVLAAAKQGGFGVFVGNCESLIIENNYIELLEETNLRTEGIRVYGHLGKRIIVKSNHLVGFSSRNKDPGIFIKALNNKYPQPVWIVEHNVALVETDPENKFIKNHNYA